MEYGLNFTIDVVVVDRQNITINIVLENHSPEDYYIDRPAILLDGFDWNPFFFTGPSNVECYDSGRVYIPKHFKLSSNSSVSTQFDFVVYCDSSNSAKAGLYNVKFISSIAPCIEENLTHCYANKLLTAETQFLLPEIPIGENLDFDE